MRKHWLLFNKHAHARARAYLVAIIGRSGKRFEQISRQCNVQHYARSFGRSEDWAKVTVVTGTSSVG